MANKPSILVSYEYLKIEKFEAECDNWKHRSIILDSGAFSAYNKGSVINLNAFREMTSGAHEDPATILSKCFECEPVDELVILRDIDFTSVCEHHLLPFRGVAHVAYLPYQKVVGLSKLARLVDCFAKRMQLQERMTQQIATALVQHLRARAVGVVVQAHHSCMGCRGVRKAGASMVTSCMLGQLRENGAMRAEFLSLIGK